MQKISPIHELSLKIQQILGFHELNHHIHSFDHAHLKIIEITFSFPEFALAYKKSVLSIYSFLVCSQF